MRTFNAFTLRRRTLAVAAAMAAAALPGVASAADTYPNRPIRLIVPQAAGSTGDILARAIGTEFARELGQPVVVDNKPSAGGTVAMAELGRSTPDGYTIGLGSQGAMVFNPSLYSRPGYDPSRDFAPVGLIGGVSNVLIVPPGSKFRDVPDLIAAARARPGAITYASGGNGTSHHLSSVLFAQLAGIELLHVPYRGAPQGIVAVMSGEVDMAFFNTPTVLHQIRSGKLRALAVTSKERSGLLPDVPTMAAGGVKGYEVNTWVGMIAPAATPQAVVTRLGHALHAALTRPDVKAALGAQGVDLAKDDSSAALATVLKDDLSHWPEVIRKSGAKLD